MAKREWIDEDSNEYEKILLFNDSEKPLMKTAPGEKLPCLIYEAYAYVTKDDKVVIGVVPKVQFATNMVDHPHLAGEYVINKITATDTEQRPHKFLVDHRQWTDLDFLNHVIDLNRPDVLDPQTIFENSNNFKEIVATWAEHHWIPANLNAQVQALPDGRCDVIPEEIPDLVLKNAGFKRALSDWRQENWFTDRQARQYAISGAPLKTIDDELSFNVQINNN